MTDSEVLEHEHFAEDPMCIESHGDRDGGNHIWTGTCRCGKPLQGAGPSAHEPSTVEWAEAESPSAWLRWAEAQDAVTMTRDMGGDD